jgi:integral membrane protein (TIGR03766 family)
MLLDHDLPLLGFSLLGAVILIFLLIPRLRTLLFALISLLYGFVARRYSLVVAALFLLLVVYQIALVSQIAAPFWSCDLETIFSAAASVTGQDLALQTAPIPIKATDADYTNYFSHFTNNGLILFLYILVFSLLPQLDSTQLWQVMDYINAVFIDIGLFMLFLAAKKEFGKRVGLLTLCLGLLAIGFTPWVTVPYTDTISLAATGTMLFLLVLIRKTSLLKTRLVYGLLLGVSAALCFLVKPSTGIYLIAAAMIAVVMLLQQYKELILKQRTWAVALAVGLCFVLVHTSFTHFYQKQQYLEIDPGIKAPVTYFMAMGMTGFGGWSREDTELMDKLDSTDEINQAMLGLIEKRLSDYKRHGYIDFLIAKHELNVNDGTYYWGESDETQLQDMDSDSSLEEFLKDLYYRDGTKVYIYQGLAQIIWFLVLLLTLFSSRDRNFLTTVLRLTIVGAFLYLLIFEGGRSRYMIQFLPAFVALAALGLNRLLLLASQKYENSCSS